MSLLDKFIILFEAHVNQTGFTKLNKNLKTATKDMQRARVQANTLFGAKGMFSAQNLFRGFVGYDLYSVVRDLPQQFIEATTKLGAMQSRFNAVADTAHEGGEQLRWVSEQSRRLGLDLYNTADNYSIFYATVKKTLGSNVAQDIFGKWMEAFRVLHIPVEQQSRVLYALREMSSKGKIYMQDLAMQLGSAVPGTMPIATKAMGYGTDTEAFRKAITEGKVDVNKFLKVFTDAIHEQYASADAVAKAMQAPDAQIQRMTANWQQLLLSFAEAGVSKDLVTVLTQVNSLLDFAVQHSQTIYNVLKSIIKIIGVIMAFRLGTKFLKFAQGIGIAVSKTGSLLSRIVRLGVATSKFHALAKLTFKSLFKFLGKSGLTGVLASIGTLIGGPIGGAIGMALGLIIQIVTSIALLNDLFKAFTGENIWQGILNGLKVVWGWVVNIGEAISNWFNRKRFIQTGMSLPEGGYTDPFKQQLKQNAGNVSYNNGNTYSTANYINVNEGTTENVVLALEEAERRKKKQILNAVKKQPVRYSTGGMSSVPTAGYTSP